MAYMTTTISGLHIRDLHVWFTVPSECTGIKSTLESFKLETNILMKTPTTSRQMFE